MDFVDMRIEKLVIFIFVVSVILNSLFKSLGIPIYWPSVLIVFFFILIKHTELLFKPINLLSLAFLFVLYLYDIDNVYSDLKLPLGNLSFFIPFFMSGLITELLHKCKKYGLVIFAGQVSFYALSLLSIFTLIELSKNPMIVRGTFQSDVTQDLIMYSFVEIYFLPFFIAIPLFSDRFNLFLHQKVLLFLSAIVLLSAGFSTAIFITALSVGVVLYLRFKDKSFFYKSLLFILGILIYQSYSFILDFIVESLPGDLANAKKEELSNINYESLDSFLSTYRQGVYHDSFKSFLNNPIFGNSTLDFGQHSSVLDKLGLFGLIGAFIFFIFYFTLYKNSFKLLNFTFEKKYLKIFFIVIIISMTFNPLDIYYMKFYYLFFLLLPCILSFFSNQNVEKPL